MNGLNDAFYFVIDKIITMQAFFTGTAWAIGRVALTISVVSAAVNYGLTGTGLKENIIKMLKAVVFFVIVMAAYPKIVSWITTTTFNLAQNAAYDQDMQNSMNRARATIISAANDTNNAGGDKSKDTYAKTVLTSDTVNKDPASFFGNMLGERTAGEITYTTVAPAAALEAILLVAGECVKRGSEGEPKLHIGPVEFPNLGTLFIGLLCGFCVIFTGIFAVLEYLIAYLEFMLVAAVGIILFPLSLWEGSKFMAEKFISAMIGFFIKLLLCSVCIFLMIWGYLSLAALFTQKPFTADVDQVLMILFTCLLFFYICKSAPGLAQGLLTGTPSLSATGAISAVAGAAGAVMGAAGAAGAAGKAGAAGLTKATFAGAGALTQAGAAAKAVKTLEGGLGAQAGAFVSSMAGSAGEAFKSSGGSLVRSLLAGKNGGGGGANGTGGGINRHSQTQKFFEKNADGTQKTFKEQFAARAEAGTTAGEAYMAKQEAKRNKKNETNAKPEKT